jgi:hydroxymethylglutaryl-CoA lyase
MAEIVRITDVSPRDGLQNERGAVPTADKVRLIDLLLRSGVDEIEATSFVSPKWIPQLADAADVLEGVRGLETRSKTTLSVLVPNAKGFARALEIHNAGLPLKIAVFTAASETFSQKNTNATVDETIERFGEFLPAAFDAGMAVRFYISCAIACPFEGVIAPGAVRRVADLLLALAPDDAITKGKVEIDLGDTIGAAHPSDIAALLGVFSPAEIEQLLVVHLHDTFGRASECVATALELGVRSFDGSAGGLGGCPYAGTPDKPAPGNIATGALLDTIESMGMETNVDRVALDEASAFAQSIIKRAHS